MRSSEVSPTREEMRLETMTPSWVRCSSRAWKNSRVMRWKGTYVLE